MKKRSKNIDLNKMRKGQIVSSLLVAGAALTSIGCEEEEKKEKVTIVESVEDCVKETKLTKKECEVARANAIVAAEKSAPKFSDQKSCEEQFGYGRCNGGNNGVFMPLMTGFMIGNMMNSGSHHHYTPVYTSGTGSNTRYVGSSGSTIGSPGQRSYSVPTSVTRVQPRSTVSSTKSAYRARAAAKATTAKTTTTTSRSGWGSSGSAKSSGSSRSSWGG